MFPVSTETSEAGFTLLEMIAVVAIISLAVSMAPSIHGRLIPSFELRQLANDIANESRLVRQRARLTGVSDELSLGDGDQTVSVGERIFELDEDILVTMQATNLVGAAADNRIRFFADGGISGGTLTLTRNTLSVAVEYDWLSGSIEVAQ